MPQGELFDGYIAVSPDCDYVSRVIDDVLLENNNGVGIAKFSLELSRRVQVKVPTEITAKLKDRSLARLKIADGMVKGAVPLFELVTDAEPRYNHYRKLGYSFYRLKDGIVQKEK